MLFKKAENNRIPKVKCRLNQILKKKSGKAQETPPPHTTIKNTKIRNHKKLKQSNMKQTNKNVQKYHWAGSGLTIYILPWGMTLNVYMQSYAVSGNSFPSWAVNYRRQFQVMDGDLCLLPFSSLGPPSCLDLYRPCTRCHSPCESIRTPVLCQ